MTICVCSHIIMGHKLFIHFSNTDYADSNSRGGTKQRFPDISRFFPPNFLQPDLIYEFILNCQHTYNQKKTAESCIYRWSIKKTKWKNHARKKQQKLCHICFKKLQLNVASYRNCNTKTILHKKPHHDHDSIKSGHEHIVPAL